MIYKRYNFWGLIEENYEIPFASIDSISYDIERSQNKVLVMEFIRIYAHTSKHPKLLIGLEEFDSKRFATKEISDEYIQTPIPENYKNRGESIICAINKILYRIK